MESLNGLKMIHSDSSNSKIADPFNESNIQDKSTDLLVEDSLESHQNVTTNIATLTTNFPLYDQTPTFKANKIFISSQIMENRLQKNTIKNELSNNRDLPKINSVSSELCKNDENKASKPTSNFNHMEISGEVVFESVINQLDHSQLREENYIINEVDLNQPEERSVRTQNENMEQITLNGQVDLDEKSKILNTILQKAARSNIRIVLLMCLAVISASICLEYVVERTSSSYREIYLVCYVFWSLYLLENIIRTASGDLIPWKKLDNLFQTLDVAIILIFLIITDLRLSGFDIPAKFVFSLPLLNLILYLWLSKGPRSLKEIQATIRISYALEMFLLGGKIDGDLDWPWGMILSFIWIYFGLAAIYCLLMAITLVSVLFLKFLKINLSPELTFKSQILGLLWFMLCSSLGVIGFVTLLGLPNILDVSEEGSKSILKSSILTGRYLSVVIVVITIFSYRELVKFFVKFNIYESDYRAALGLISIDKSIVREKKNIYLVRLTSTYFSFLNGSFNVKNKDILNKLKDSMRKTKQRKFKKRDLRQFSKALNQDVTSKSVTLDGLKSDNQNLNKALESKAKQSVKEVKIVKSKRLRQDLVHIKSDPDGERHNSMNGFSRSQINLEKICLSECSHSISIEISGKNEGQEKCYLCCDKLADGVMFECNHGGICIDCAIRVVKDGGQCMECRQKVSQIIKIDPQGKLKDIVKGIEIITVNKKSQNYN